MGRRKKPAVEPPKTVPFGVALLFLMRQRGVSIEDLAAVLEVEPVKVRAMIEGWTPPPGDELAGQIAEVLGVDKRMITAAIAGRGDGDCGEG